MSDQAIVRLSDPLPALETIQLPGVRYERLTEWRRDKTIPWDLAYVVGTLTDDIGQTMKAGMVIYGKHSTRGVWLELQGRAA